MKQSTFGRLAGRWLAALLALSTTAFVASTARAAGCAGHERGRLIVMDLDAAELLGIGDSPGALQSPTRDEPPRPCTGPFCSGLPSIPSSAAPQAATGVDQWATAPQVDAPPGARAADQTQDGPLLRSIIQADPIFHPPRRPATHHSL